MKIIDSIIQNLDSKLKLKFIEELSEITSQKFGGKISLDDLTAFSADVKIDLVTEEEEGIQAIKDYGSRNNFTKEAGYNIQEV